MSYALLSAFGLGLQVHASPVGGESASGTVQCLLTFPFTEQLGWSC